MIRWMQVRLRDERTGLGWFTIFVILLYWPLAYAMEYSAIALYYIIEFCCHPMHYLWELWSWNVITFPVSLWLVGFVVLLAKDWLEKK